MDKILIGVPCMETLPVDFVNCELKLRKPIGTEIMHLSLSVPDVAREKIAQYAIANKFSHVMFIDSDMVFQADVMTKLLDYDLDIVSGLAFQRKPPYSPCLYEMLRFAETDAERVKILTHYKRGLTEVEGCGMFGCLIKTSVFEEIYKTERYIFSPYPGYGEDLTFCLRARKAGFKIYADTSIQFGHLGKVICTEDSWRQWNGVEDE